jgi:hypothetical protein
MTGTRTLIGLAVAISALLASAVPAFAEFESLGASQVKGNVVQMKLNAGAAEVECQNSEESAGKATGVTESGGKEARKGTALQVKVSEWGTCVTTLSGTTKGTSAVGSCAMEMLESKTETAVPGTFVKECLIKTGLSGCEIKVPTSNKEREDVELYDSGEENENLIVEPNLKAVTTTVNAACETLGLKGTSTATLSATIILNQVRAADVGEMVIGANPTFYPVINLAGTVTVINTGAIQIPKLWSRMVSQGGSFTRNATEETTCEGKSYGRGNSCSFMVEFKGIGGVRMGFAKYKVAGANDVETEVVLW